VEEEVCEDVVAGLDPLAADAVVLVELLDDDWERRVRERGEDHCADLLGRVVGAGLYADIVGGGGDRAGGGAD